MTTLQGKKVAKVTKSSRATSVGLIVASYVALLGVGAGAAAIYSSMRAHGPTPAAVMASGDRGELMAFSNGDLTFNIYRVSPSGERSYVGRYSADDLPAFGLTPMGWHPESKKGANVLRMESMQATLNGH